MKVETAPFDVGVIVGRFQVHELHEGHKELIQHVVDNHDKVIVVLGNSPLWASTNNPLDFQARRQMIHELFPDVEIAYVMDVNNDDLWSKSLDKIVGALVSPGQTTVLYGSRDSFIKHYTGRFDTRTLEAERVFSGTSVRAKIKGAATKATADFRAGVIWATGARFPTAYTTVDIAIMDGDRLLLGRKEGEAKYRFVGGFSDPQSGSFEDDAIREVKEETGLDLMGLRYIGSTRVDDWRYRSEPDCIKTMMFVAETCGGTANADDDLAEVKWFSTGPGNFIRENLMDAHLPLLDLLEANS